MTDLIEERMKEALIRFEGLVLDRDEDAMPFLGADARDLFPGAIKEIEEMRKERDAWRKVMQSMTPQGSEYSTPEACAAFVAMEREDRHNARVDRVKANRRTEAAEANLAKAVDTLKRIASGGLSGYVLTSNPPQDPAVFAAQSALAEIGEKPQSTAQTNPTKEK